MKPKTACDAAASSAAPKLRPVRDRHARRAELERSSAGGIPPRGSRAPRAAQMTALRKNVVTERQPETGTGSARETGRPTVRRPGARTIGPAAGAALEERHEADRSLSAERIEARGPASSWLGGSSFSSSSRPRHTDRARCGDRARARPAPRNGVLSSVRSCARASARAYPIRGCEQPGLTGHVTSRSPRRRGRLRSHVPGRRRSRRQVAPTGSTSTWSRRARDSRARRARARPAAAPAFLAARSVSEDAVVNARLHACRERRGSGVSRSARPPRLAGDHGEARDRVGSMWNAPRADRYALAHGKRFARCSGNVRVASSSHRCRPRPRGRESRARGLPSACATEALGRAGELISPRCRCRRA